jgi:hypothetical protein
MSLVLVPRSRLSFELECDCCYIHTLYNAARRLHMHYSGAYCCDVTGLVSFYSTPSRQISSQAVSAGLGYFVTTAGYRLGIRGSLLLQGLVLPSNHSPTHYQNVTADITSTHLEYSDSGFEKG